MKQVVALLVVCACAGPTQSQLAETPAARGPARHTEAPPASTSDKDRERLIQQFDDMETTQRAYEQAEQRRRPAPPQTPARATKRGPAEQATLPAKKGPAEQATLPAKKGPAEQAPPGATP